MAALRARQRDNSSVYDIVDTKGRIIETCYNCQSVADAEEFIWKMKQYGAGLENVSAEGLDCLH